MYVFLKLKKWRNCMEFYESHENFEREIFTDNGKHDRKMN